MPEPNPTTTRTIAGHDITLTPGRRYHAVHNTLKSGEHFVNIHDVTESFYLYSRPAWKVTGLGYRDAKQLVREFNANAAGRSSGRIWE
ncbi:MAG: hypothetical protein ACJ72N_07465 [Labedaea sp.]